LIIKDHGKDSILSKALGRDLKGKSSPVLYILGIIASFFNVWISGALFILVAIIWLIPDRRIEMALKNEKCT
jgi:uncharacterized membrane protein